MIFFSKRLIRYITVQKFGISNFFFFFTFIQQGCIKLIKREKDIQGLQNISAEKHFNEQHNCFQH